MGLALTRREGEWIEVTHPDGTLVVVTFVRAEGDRVKLVIEAPEEVKIMRGEVVVRDAARAARERGRA